MHKNIRFSAQSRTIKLLWTMYIYAKSSEVKKQKLRSNKINFNSRKMCNCTETWFETAVFLIIVSDNCLFPKHLQSTSKMSCCKIFFYCCTSVINFHKNRCTRSGCVELLTTDFISQIAAVYFATLKSNKTFLSLFHKNKCSNPGSYYCKIKIITPFLLFS